LFKEIVHPENTILSLFPHPQVVPNLNAVSFSMENNGEMLKNLYATFTLMIHARFEIIDAKCHFILFIA